MSGAIIAIIAPDKRASVIFNVRARSHAVIIIVRELFAAAPKIPRCNCNTVITTGNKSVEVGRDRIFRRFHVNCIFRGEFECGFIGHLVYFSFV